MISSIRLDGTTACLAIEGATNGEVFEAYAREILNPTLKPGDIVIMDNLSAHKRQAAIEEVYPNLHRISIDYGVMEKADRVILCEMDCDWLDVGSWTSLEGVLGTDAAGQVVAASNTITVDSKNNVLVCEDDHLLATIGLEDIVIVRSADATLVCHKKDVQKIKDLVSKLDEQYL